MMVYLTALAFDEGATMQFFDDIYSRDALLLQELEEDFQFTPPKCLPDYLQNGAL
ncbi:MAG: hypothetical protein P8Y95_13395 [Gammaproteobacteria bacterium]|jgi:murein L,D-transpeptidase YcbB/YkuD